MSIILQTLRDQLADGRIFEAIVGGLTGALPLPVVALLVFGSIGASYYLVQQRVIIPVIMTILVGGVTIARVPSGFAQGLLAVFVLVLGGAVYVLLQRVSTS
jgi:hypothetical protein